MIPSLCEFCQHVKEVVAGKGSDFLMCQQSAAGQTVDVQKTEIDAYGRTLGVVRVDGINANTKLIEDGWAWHLQRFNDDERLAKLKDAARQAKRGLWADKKPLDPWEYRARQATPKAVPVESKDQKRQRTG